MTVVDTTSPLRPVSTFTLDVGARVAVRNRYLGTWSVGFEIAAVHGDGCSVTRKSDGTVLPEVIPFRDLRDAGSVEAGWA